MAYTIPTTQADGNLIDQTDWNTDLVENIKYLKSLTVLFADGAVVSPSQITSNQNDYNPTSLSTAFVLRLSSDAARSITGLQGGAAARVIAIHNVGSFAITLVDESASSTAAYRFALPGDLALGVDQVAMLQYDATSARWRLLGGGTVPDGDKGDVVVSGGVWSVESVSGVLALTGDISPSAIGANQNDYNPTGLSTASTLRLSSSANYSITSLAGGADGRLILIHNVGSFDIVLTDDDGATGTAGNRFALQANLRLLPDTSALLQYDATSSRWRVVATSGFYKGQIAQVQSQTYTAAASFSSSSGAWGDTGVTVAITPKSSASVMAVQANVDLLCTTQYAYAKLVRDSTDIGVGDAASSRVRASFGSAFTDGSAMIEKKMSAGHLDSPATTSATTYKVQVMAVGPGPHTVDINRSTTDTDGSAGREASNITVMEVIQ